MIDNIDQLYADEKTSFSQTLMNLLKTNIGIGILTLPFAILSSGLFFGAFLIIFVGVVISYNMLIISETNAFLISRYFKHKLGFAGTVKYSLKPYLNTKALTSITYFINGFIILYMIGSCSVYIISASQIINQIINSESGDPRIYSCIMVFPIIFLSLYSNLNVISIISTISNIFILIGLAFVLVFSLVNINSPSKVFHLGSFGGIPQTINTVVFAYEGVCSIFPIINALDDRSLTSYLISVSGFITILFYFLMGVFGFLAFQNHTKPQVLLNLPHCWFMSGVRLIYSIGVLLSLLVMVYYILSIIIPPIFRYGHFNKSQKVLIDFVMRFFIIISAFAIAVCVPWLEDMLNIMGSFFAIPLSFMIPPFLHTIAFIFQREITSKSILKSCINLIVFLFGFIFTILGISSTIKSLNLKIK